MISDDRLHKTRFCKKGGLNKTFLIMRELEQNGGRAGTISYFEGGLAKKSEVTFLGGIYPGAQYV